MNDKYSALETYFGYSAFRNGQEEVIDSILSARDVLGVMPTGAGKSLCYQIPALILPGITLVISPLISLMKDQVGALCQAGVPAAFINSTLSPAQQHLAIQNARTGMYKIIYAAPERLLSAEFLEFSLSAQISFVSIDEAHCVSQWGQDFRPSYLRIPEFISQLPVRPVVGSFTATATARVKEDIITLLGLREPTVVTTGFNRENLYFEVSSPGNKFSALLDFLDSRREKSGIIYCQTRKSVEEVCGRLCSMGYIATRYHAGLADRERKENQEAFQIDAARVMVATNAFGMGIDKSNVSYVVHYNMPKNMESYYQEAGRAGRDGSPAECVLFYSGQDVVTCRFFIDKAGEDQEMDPQSLLLFKQHERERLKQMTFYCHTRDCLRAYILRYFGERPPDYCGNCSNCLQHFEKLDITIDAQKILSCVKRMRERYGIKLVVDTLRGKETERILSLGLHKLTTYGIMKERSEKQLREMIQFLLAEAYLVSTNDEYPVLSLTAKAKGVLFGDEKLSMNISKELPAKKARSSAVFTAIANPRLYSKLQALRTRLAREQSVPAYVIFPDATLREMCRYLPGTKDDLGKINGVGSVKLQRYGEQFLEIIRQEGASADPAREAEDAAT